MITTGTEALSESKGLDLDRSLVRGIAWTGTSRWAAQLISWGSTLVLARLLRPSDYGLIAMATVYMALVRLVGEFGIGITVVTVRTLSADQTAQINGLSLLLGAASMLLSCAVAVPLGRFFHAPGLPAVVIALSVGFVVASLRSVPQAILQRDLRFKLLAMIESVRAISAATAALGFAVLGFGYWALVLNELVGSFTATMLTLAFRRHRIAFPRASALRGVLAFSGHVLGSRIAWYTYENADFMIAGRVLGQAALGAYGMAWTLTSLPIEKIYTVIASVAPTFFSAVQHDARALRRYLLMLTEGLALAVFPVAIGLALVASDAVPLVIGPQWTSAVLPLQILAIYTTIRAVMPLLPHVLNATGQSPFVMYNAFVAAVLLPAGFLVGSRWGTSGIAMAWVLVYPFTTLPLFVRVFRTISMSPAEYFSAVRPALVASAVMIALGTIARYAAGADTAGYIRLVAVVAAGGVGYTGTVLMLHRERLTALYRLVATAR